LYVKPVDGGEPRQLTDASSYDTTPVWSPDGTEIAFLRIMRAGFEGESAVYVVSSFGGGERRLGEVSTADSKSGGWSPGLDWSPDGSHLAVTDRPEPGEPPAIFLLSMDTGEKRRVTTPPANEIVRDKLPTFSPDGQSLAFVRMMGNQRADAILVASLDVLEPRVLSPEAGMVYDLEWSPDGDSLLYTSEREAEGVRSLWRQSATGGEAEELPFGRGAFTLSLDDDQRRLVYDVVSYPNADIWRVPGPGGDLSVSPTRLISSTRPDWGAVYSPDGRHIAFTSMRSGPNNIWVCNADGRECRQLTEHERATMPAWSPDSKKIAYNVEEGSRMDVYVIDLESRFIEQITDEASIDAGPWWSADARWIYFHSNREGEFSVWRVPGEGGEAVPFIRDRGARPIVSEDGRFLFYAVGRNAPTVWRAGVDGGEAMPILEGAVWHWTLWTLWRDRLVYIRDGGEESYILEQFDLGTMKASRLFSIQSVTGAGSGLTVSPDGQWVLLSLDEEQTGDIYLVESGR
jgi:Tol biopolymer transport system component